MEIERRDHAHDGSIEIRITVSKAFLEDCEPYGPPELCSLITEEQGLGIIEDAILTAMHLKRK